MKSLFLKSAVRLAMKSLSILFLLCFTLASFVLNAAEPLWSNSGFITTATNIDAISFYNSGDWNIVTTRPFTTADTLNYTNTGQMSGDAGWEFDLGPTTTGSRGWSALFLNGGTTATISASTNGDLGYLLISATNIVNQGRLLAGDAAEIILNGSSVDLSRSYTEITPISALPMSLLASANNVNGKTFTPATAVFDEFWGQGSIVNIQSGTLWDGTTATNGPIPFQVSQPCGVTNALATMGFMPTISSSKQVTVLDPVKLTPEILTIVVTNMNGTTNTVSFPTNVIRQAVFVHVTDTNITPQITFTPSAATPGGSITNSASTANVRLRFLSKDFITQTPLTNDVYVIDTMLSVPSNTGLLTNAAGPNPYAGCNDPTFRPANYIVARTDPGEFASGSTGVSPVPNNYFTTGSDGPFTNVLVNLTNTAYSALLDNQAIQQTFNSVTNLPGRVRVYANNLNLKNASIRGEGEVVLQASNLISSAGALIDCQNLDYNFGSTNGILNLTNLASTSVKRFHGTVSTFSATWQEIEQVITPNWEVFYNTNGVVTNAVEMDLTNYGNYTLYTMLVDASNLLSSVPVDVQNLTLHSTNIVIGDSMDVIQNFLFDGQSLTLDKNLLVENWNFANAPTLLYFTNNGVLDIPGVAHFGDDGPTNYLWFVNASNALIFCGGQYINSSNLLFNYGTDITQDGDLSITTQNGQLSGATVESVGDIQFSANNLSLTRSNFLSAQHALDFNVSNSLSDNGIGAGNNFYCQSGFNLLTKPTTGDLKGTTIYTMASYGGAEVDHLWAGEDRGATQAGYTNNTVLADLVLSPQGNVNFFPPLFVFSGMGVDNGLYVGNLDLSQLNNTNEIQINPNLTIYYLTASFNGTNGAENYLNGKFGGHLVWAQSVPHLVQKQNFSKMFQLTASYDPSSNLEISGIIMPGQTNIIQASTDLVNWIPIYTNIGSYTNLGPTTITDPDAKDFPNRFYRVVTP